MSLPKRILYYGTDKPLAEQLTLHAGPLSVICEDGSLRSLKLGDTTLVHQIYSAVRDHNWDTIAPVLSNVQIETGAEHFSISYISTHQQDDIDFIWTGTITGNSEGTIVFSMDGEARTSFQRNRIGFCVLHPMTVAGQPCIIEHTDGNTETGNFPQHIAPHQPYFDIRAISHEIVPGLWAEVRMEGDTFEMEDQRNWTDASYKTYCTPLGLPFPVTVEAGERIQQTVTIRLKGDVPDAQPDAPGHIAFTIGQQIHPLPPIGLGAASHGKALTSIQIERLRALNVSHLRLDLRLWQEDAESRLRQISAEAAHIGTALELAIHLSNDAENELQRLRKWLDETKSVIRHYLIFHKDEKSTSSKWVDLARTKLNDAPVAAGTDAFFTEINRQRPDASHLDGVCFSLNPQVHAFDNQSLVETLAAQAPTVISTRAFMGADLPVSVTPVTLKMRWNPNATGPEPQLNPSELPSQVDPRQMSLFGAGWTLGSIKYLTESSADSITYYETTGLLGIMATETGSPLPDKFAAGPDSLYPMYFVFLDIGEFAGGWIIHSQSSSPLKIDGLVLQKDDKQRIMLTNFTDQAQTVSLPDLPSIRRIKTMDASNVENLMLGTAEAEHQTLSNSSQITLAPYAVVCIDGEIAS